MRNKKVFLTMLISQILFGMFTFIWFVTALMSFMIFDNPAGEHMFWPLLVFIVYWLYPIALIASIIMSWLLYRKGKMKAAVTISLVPLLWVLALASLFLFT
ncbi:hypothetical protein [Paenibacillus sinopodophylli]|uniref:hypothetical protein n=1 Tax=Paenibacillus sinopodophylli TaxID=1837342 RepID=UPI00110CBC3D|nr:hypothetical protein [Paenibacillus sinopodophylli]